MHGSAMLKLLYLSFRMTLRSAFSTFVVLMLACASGARALLALIKRPRIRRR